MPSAFIISPLRCWKCNKLLVKEGKLKCSWCGEEVPAELGKDKIFCPTRRHRRVLLAKRDKAVCPRCGEQTPIIKEEKEMIRIVIERKDGHLGFSMEHQGIFDNRREPYGGSFGTIAGLKETVVELLNRIEENDKKLVEELKAMTRNEALPLSIRNAAIEEFNKRAS